MSHRCETTSHLAMRVATRTEEVDGPGGDFSRALETAPDRLVLVVGDVTGHGARAARYRSTLTERLAGLPRVASQQGACAAHVLEAINLAVQGRWPSDILAGMVCIDVDARRRRASIAVGGHLPPVFKSIRGARVLPVSIGPAVGMFPRRPLRRDEPRPDGRGRPGGRHRRDQRRLHRGRGSPRSVGARELHRPRARRARGLVHLRLRARRSPRRPQGRRHHRGPRALAPHAAAAPHRAAMDHHGRRWVDPSPQRAAPCGKAALAKDTGAPRRGPEPCML